MESIFLDRKKAHDKLREHPPTHIAVAYVGRDWDQLIDCSQLKEIIVSPTLGTNPRAVAEIAEQIGWDHVHFLDELHAKIYIATDAVILGSFNLSKNALDCSRNNGLLEAGIFSSDPSMLKDTKELYDLCKYKALRQYPTAEAKKTKLSELEIIRNQAIEKNIIVKPESITLPKKTIPTYLNEYKIAWFTVQQAEVNLDAFVDGVTIKESGLTVSGGHCFAQEDAQELKQGQWILAWRITNKNEPHKNYSEKYFYWTYVHHLVRDGYKDSDVCEDFPLVAFEWDEKVKPEPPFELNAVIYEAFKQTVAEDRFAHFSMNPDGSIWNLRGGNANIEEFVNVWRENLAKLSN